MDLHALGFDDWFGAHASAIFQPGHNLVRVMTADRGAFLVRNEYGESTAELAGKFRFAAESSADLPCVGDWVAWSTHRQISRSFMRSCQGGPFCVASAQEKRWTSK